MKFVISSMWVDSFSLTRTTEKTSDGKEFTMSIDTAVDYNTKDKRSFRLALSLKLIKNEKFIFNASQMAVVKFDRDMSETDAHEELATAIVVNTLYPYVRAFTIATTRLAGYNNINLPVVIAE
ncbi:protein-export chaperone SecB [Citrobacter koseri]|uniref:protein-export chaperone SecB n=1 Tax=Citrobacter koseri TaxID=545 RepID=UPI0019009292|nr:protein-export chaperone SecB [Citrobacter koseri]MBJ9818038.1 protein-export chaperone SecB [Citrobacter koseri]MDT7459962.1 protein-export chaperone SecB [Citrobacter koseri]